MQDAFVKGASEIRLKSQCFDTGFNREENTRRQCNAVDWISNTISEIFPWETNVIKRRQAQLHAKTETAKTICRYRKVLNTENYLIIEHLTLS